ncbi:AarF/ABC1/UbiB kinase family protein [Rhodobacteraceae bacterium SC52]|nr:AarF/ABC1/UbiB kinase family protein [Rhodobacteraceae bacterium SC52]
MTNRPDPSRSLAVPSGRFVRLARFGSMAGGVAGNMAVTGAKEAISGRRPTLQQLLMTPANATRITRELARMRGAAMKVGQLVSMETGDFLPPELADILSRLRAQADFMPPKQLRTVLSSAWGRDFTSRFDRFDVRPIAAASIGQVHRARTKDGADLAIKVQYPGVRRSIDADVDNVASLIRLTGLLPSDLDIAPLLAEAKRQLHEEADYEREGRFLGRFSAVLSNAPEFAVPSLHAELSTKDVLAMSFIPGVAVEDLITAPQETRDTVMTRLVALVLRELFEFRMMQTDPNFANYRWCEDTGRVVLLDFGATREFPVAVTDAYLRLLKAGVAQDKLAMADAGRDVGFIDARTTDAHEDILLNMFDMVMVPLRKPGNYDFGVSDLAARLRAEGMVLGEGRDFWTIPPMDTLYLQRKIAGMFLLATRLQARVPVSDLVRPYL